MIFLFFAAGIAAAFLSVHFCRLHLGRYLGSRYPKHEAVDAIAGLATVKGAIFGLMGLLLAFTIAGALQQFDDCRQLVLLEVTAAATAYDCLGHFEGQLAHDLRQKLKDDILARADLYPMPRDFLL